MKKLLLLLFLILLVAAGVVYYKKWRNEFIRKKVPQLVFLKSDSLYRITYDTVDVDEVDGQIVIRNLQLIPDSTYKKPTDSTLPQNLMKVTVPEVFIAGVQTDAAVLEKKVIARTVKLTRPVVTMYSNKAVKNDNDDEPDTTATTDKIYQILLRGLEKIMVDTITITDADYHICQWPKGDTIFSGSKINAQLLKINISDSTSTDTARVLFAEQASLQVNKVVIHEKKKRYNYSFNDIELHTAERSFAVKNLHIDPLLGEAAFMKAAQYQTDRFDFNLHGLLFEKVQVQELLNGNLIADVLTINKGRFMIYRDKAYPDKVYSRVGHYPQQELLKIPVTIALKKVIIQNSYIQYKEKNPLSNSAGEVVFDDASATITNITNRKASLRNNSLCTLNFNCRFLSKVPLSATLQFYLNSNNGRFNVNGIMKTADATLFNLLSKPMAMVEINSGTIQQLDFNLICDDHKAKGIIRLLYDDLKVKILKKEEPTEKEFKTKKVVSLVANLFIKNGNPEKNKSVRIVTVNHARDTQRSLFNLIWKSIFEGIQKTVGMPPVPPKGGGKK